MSLEHHQLNSDEEKLIREARLFFETPHALKNMSEALGQPLTSIQKKLPEAVQRALSRLSEKALFRALKLALKTVPKQASRSPENIPPLSTLVRPQKTMATVSGLVGGFWGFPGLVVEIPTTTVIIMNSIAKTAHEFGEDLNDPDTQLECLYIFGMDAPGRMVNSTESAYYSSRIAFAGLIKNAAANFSKGAVTSLGLNPVIRSLLSKVASRYQLRLGQKFLSQTAPVIGALGGATLNYVFMQHYEKAAYFHFGMRHLERKHGAEQVQKFFMKDLG